MEEPVVSTQSKITPSLIRSKSEPPSLLRASRELECHVDHHKTSTNPYNSYEKMDKHFLKNLPDFSSMMRSTSAPSVFEPVVDPHRGSENGMSRKDLDDHIDADPIAEQNNQHHHHQVEHHQGPNEDVSEDEGFSAGETDDENPLGNGANDDNRSEDSNGPNEGIFIPCKNCGFENVYKDGDKHCPYCNIQLLV
ncbi:hypothetical protein QR680_000228 [Steinernema hermaphroditum]|uniref:Uncharacterized protein n=1 Tax=Steinernema hermaphroditum TaxID=289476 RepID=A0AA39LDY4_9BILA|nr:hypothetical protein QR680_000228 [Steinernema hermaphroditum]